MPDIANIVAMPWGTASTVSLTTVAPWTATQLLTSLGGPLQLPGAVDLVTDAQRLTYLTAKWVADRDVAEAQAILTGDYQELTGTVTTWYVNFGAATNGTGLTYTSPRNSLAGVQIPNVQKFRLLFAKGTQQLPQSMLFGTDGNLMISVQSAMTELLIGSYDPADGSRELAYGQVADLRCAATIVPPTTDSWLGRPIMRIDCANRPDVKVIVSGLAGHNPGTEECYDFCHVINAVAGTQIVREFCYPGVFPPAVLQNTGFRAGKAYGVTGQATVVDRFLRMGGVEGDGLWYQRPTAGGSINIEWCDMRQPGGGRDIAGPDSIQINRAGTAIGAITIRNCIGWLEWNTKANVIISGGTKSATGESIVVEGCLWFGPDTTALTPSLPDGGHALGLNLDCHNATIRGNFVSGSSVGVKVDGNNATVVGNVIVRQAMNAIVSGTNYFAGLQIIGTGFVCDLNTVMTFGQNGGSTAISLNASGNTGVARNNVVVGNWTTALSKPGSGVTESGTFINLADDPDTRFDRVGRIRASAITELVATVSDAGVPTLNFLRDPANVTPKVRGALQILAPLASESSTPSDPGSLVPTNQIPQASQYTIAHTVTLVDDASGNTLRLLSASVSTDAGSVCYTLQAELSGIDFTYFATLDLPVVTLTIDGIVFRFIIESIRRSRSFVSSSISITGRSISMIAGSPYQIEKNWINEGVTAASQLVIFSQVDTETDVVWELEDWLVPDKVWSYTGTPLAVAQRVAESVAGIVRSDRALNRLYITPRYPVPPNEWHVTAPDCEINIAGVESESYERADQPAYNAVYVSGQQQGSLAYVRLAGTNGDQMAPMVTDQLLTELPANRMRGEAILGAGGRQVRQQLTLPVIVGTARPGILELNDLCRVVDPEATWWGMVRAVSVQINVSNDVPIVQQTVMLERKLELVEGTTSEAPPPLGQEVGGVVLTTPTPAPAPGIPVGNNGLPSVNLDPGPPLVDGTTRNVFRWPWRSNSYWNIPLGRSAQRIKLPIKMSPPGYTGADWYVLDVDPTPMNLNALAPMTPVYGQKSYVKGDNDKRCADGSNSTGTVIDRLPFPASFILPSDLENASGALIRQDGRTIVQQQPVTHCKRGGALSYLYQPKMIDQDILLGDGHNGSHGGGQIGGLGGCLFIGDLGPDQELGPQRVLGLTWNFTLNGARPVNYGGVAGGRRRYPDFPGGSFRGIAAGSDSGTFGIRGYGVFSNPSMPRGMVMGARLCLHPDATPESLGIETEPGRKLFWTAQRFGFCIGDESGYSPRDPTDPPGENPNGLGAVLLWAEQSDPAGFTTAKGTFIPGGDYKTWFQSVWAPTLGANCWGGTAKGRIRTNTPWTRDLQRIYLNLYLVEDDSAARPGGDGERMWRSAPEPAIP